MPDPDSGSATAKTSTFYTDADGYLKTPEKLPLGRYRVVEIEGPEGFFNDEQYNVVFELTSERVWEVVGNATDDHGRTTLLPRNTATTRRWAS